MYIALAINIIVSTVNVRNPNTFGFQTQAVCSVQNWFECLKRPKSERSVRISDVRLVDHARLNVRISALYAMSAEIRTKMLLERPECPKSERLITERSIIWISALSENRTFGFRMLTVILFFKGNCTDCSRTIFTIARLSQFLRDKKQISLTNFLILLFCQTRIPLI